ncbi:MAG TPA: hypothetical protein VM680_06955 [Verrucomicrobiae bacterium]|nr:hypothetical protein [Verrucomicrobiae bacterium]
MLAICEQCGHRNDVPDSAENSEVACQKCAQLFFALSERELSGNRRATKWLVVAIVLFLAIIFLLLFSRSGSKAVKTAQRALVGDAIAQKLGGQGGTGGGGSADGGLPDPLATNVNNSPDASIGRPARNLGVRKPGDEVRPGAAGTDDPDPAGRIGNSRTGQVTNAPSAGGNRGNSDRRNSVETPEGDELTVGSGAGAEASALESTNTQSDALLLDDFSERLRQAGARSGDVQVSLEWKSVNDLDLHVIDPSGERIFYNHRQSQSGGQLDVDMNAGPNFTARPVENVYWPERGAPRGTYKVEVVHFANHGARDPTIFNVRVINKGQSTYYRGYINFRPTPARMSVSVCTFGVQ